MTATRALAIAAGVAAAAWCWYAWLAPHGCITRDEAWLLDCADRVARGAWPVRDFKTIYGPGLYVLFASVLRVFGADLLAVRLTWATLRAIAAAATFRAGTRLMPAPLAVGAALTLVVAPGPWHKTLFALITSLVLMFALDHAETGRRRAMIAAGLTAGIGAWFRQDAAAFVAFGVASAWAAEAWRGDAERRTRAIGALRDFLVPCVGAFVVLLLAQAPLVAPWDYFQALVWDAAQAGHPAGTRVADLIGGDTVRYGAMTGLAIGVVLGMLTLAAGTLRDVWRALGAGPSARGIGLWMVAATALASSQQLAETNALTRLLQCGVPFHLLWFASAAAAWPRARADARAAGTTLLVASWPVALAGLMALPDHLAVFAPEYGGGIGLVLERNRPFELRGRTYYCSLDGVRQLRELRELVAKIPDGASLFISPNPPSLNFVSGHRNPTRYVRVDESAPDAVRAAMEEVAGGAGNWLLLQTDFVFDVAPQARRVLAEQFSHEGDQGKFTLWRRRQGKRGEGDGEEVEP